MYVDRSEVDQCQTTAPTPNTWNFWAQIQWSLYLSHPVCEFMSWISRFFVFHKRFAQPPFIDNNYKSPPQYQSSPKKLRPSERSDCDGIVGESSATMSQRPPNSQILGNSRLELEDGLSRSSSTLQKISIQLAPSLVEDLEFSACSQVSPQG